MKLTVPVSLVLLILSGAVVFVTEAGHARWDAFLSQTRHKRSASSWQSRDTNPTCTLTGLTADDTLGRRASGLLSPPQSQGLCGNCWAFAATHTFTDFRSVSHGSRTSQLSSQYLTACATNNRESTPGTTRPTNGCCGDNPVNGVSYFQDEGAVTDRCVPYELSGYLSGISGGENERRAYKGANPIDCPANCSDGTAVQPENIRLNLRHLYGPQEETDVIAAVRMSPVIAAMNVPDRFFNYRCGVFCSDPTDTLVGKHAVEIVDYGTTSSGIDFWVVKNSWGSGWGEGGYFRIRRGDSIFAYVALVVSISHPVSPPATNYTTCGPETVSNPSQHTLVLSAVDAAVMQLNGRIPCRDNSPATSISLVSVTNATAQIVDGVIFTFNIVVNVQGCTQTTQANVSAVVVS